MWEKRETGSYLNASNTQNPLRKQRSEFTDASIRLKVETPSTCPRGGPKSELNLIKYDDKSAGIGSILDFSSSWEPSIRIMRHEGAGQLARSRHEFVSNLQRSRNPFIVPISPVSLKE